MFSKTFFRLAKAEPELIVNNRKFDLALRDSPVVKLKQVMASQTVTLDSSILMLHISEASILEAQTNYQLWPCILANIIDQSRGGLSIPPFKHDISSRVYRLIHENMELQHNHMTSCMLTEHNEHNAELLERWIQQKSQVPTLVRNLLHLEHELGVMVEMAGSLVHKLRSKTNREDISKLRNVTTYTSKLLRLKASWNKTVVYIEYQDEAWILPTTYLLLLHNKTCDALSSLILLQGSAGVCYENDAYDIGVDLMRELSQLALTRDDYFEIAKALEGLVIAETLIAEENWFNPTLRNSIEFELSKTGYTYYGSTLQILLLEASTPLRHELAGLIKIPGHPFISVEGTARKAYERATKSTEINYSAIQMTRNLALEQLIRNYIIKHGKWPPIHLDPAAPNCLREAHRLNRDPSSQSFRKKYGTVTSDMYVYVTLEKILEFDKLDHYSQYLKDKAVTVMKQEAIAHYITKELSQLDWKEGRLLLVHLLHHEDEHDLKGYLRSYMSSSMRMEDILNYLVIKLVPKEKELKVEARPFGCKTYHDRYRSCVQEENVKHLLDLYFEDQAMTLDNLSLIQRLRTFRTLHSIYKGWRVLYINFDVSGWCGNFRHETVEPITHDILDAAFGTGNFFGKTQLAYENGFFYLPDQNGTYYWDGQDGGIEGLNQYTWMTVYIPQMRYALREFGLHYFVMAYGDDYKAALLIPPDQRQLDIGVLRERVVTAVANTARLEFGQNMKVFDSYGSEAYISFCKNASVNASEMPQGVRKIQKCYGATNAFLPTLDDYISSAFSNAHAAAKVMPCTYPAYRTALFWGYQHLLTHAEWDGASDIELHCAMLVPSCAGGLPVLYLSNFHTRAENDHLPMFLDLVAFMRRLHPELYMSLTNALDFDKLDRGVIEPLLRDPYSLPIKKPPLPSGVLRAEVIPALGPIVRNSELRALIEAATDDWTDRLVKAMWSCNYINARIFSSVYACTPKAMVEEIVKRFETSASIRDILVMRRGPRQTLRIMRRVLEAEITLQKWRRSRFVRCYYEGEFWVSGMCSTELANKLRMLWGKEIIGVTMPAMPHLLTVVNDYLGTLDEYSRRHHFTYMTMPHSPVIKRSPSDHWDLGTQPPFLGHRTRLGSDIPQAKIIESNPFLSKIKTLLDIVSWVEKGERQPDGSVLESNFQELIFVLLSQYIRGDPKELLPFGAKRKSGTIQHHWRSPHYSEHIMPNTLYNTYTWVVGESNTHELLRGTVDHHTLNFLQAYCFSVHMIQIQLEVNPEHRQERTYWVITNDCDVCMTPIREPPLVIDILSLPAKKTIVLEGLEITTHSRKALTDATHQLLEKKPRDNTEHLLPVQLAVCGVVQALAEQSGARAKRICDHAGAPARTQNDIEALSHLIPGGWSFPIKEREIRHSPIRVLTMQVLNQIYRMTFSLGRKSSVRRQLQKIWQSNPRGLPWCPLVDTVHRAGRLADLIITVHRVSGMQPPLCYDNVLTASRYLGEVALNAGLQGNLPLHYVWLSYYESDDVKRALEDIHRQVVTTVIWSCYRPLLLQSLRARVKDTDTIHSIVTAIYHAACVPQAEPDTVREMLEESTDQVIVLSVIDENPLTEDMYDAALEDPTHLVHDVVDELIRMDCPMGPHPPEYGAFLDHLEIADEVYRAEAKPRSLVTFCQSTLADCVNRVRELPDSTPLEYRHGEPGAVRLDLQYRPTSSKPQFGFIVHGLDTPAVSTVDPRPTISQIFDTSEIILGTHGASRQYGHATASMNKVLELLDIVGVDMRSLTSTNIMCLAEGYGGILDLFARLGRRSHFLYNTIPPDLRTYTTPAVAVETLRTRGHTWDEQLVNTSVYDLREVSTAAAIVSNDSHRYSVTTCDAEADWSRPTDYGNLLRNTIHIYLSKRTNNGLLLCKIMLEHTQVCIRILSLLAHYSEHVGLCRLLSSPPGGECYIVAWGHRRSYALDATEWTSIIPQIDRLVMTTTERLTTYWTGLVPPNDFTVRLVLPPHQPFLRSLRNDLPCGPIHRLLGRHQLPLTLSDNDWATNKSLVSALIRELKFTKDTLKLDLEAGTDTAAGMVHLVLRMILVEGCLQYLSLVHKKNILVYRHAQVRNHFLQFTQSLTHRVVLPQPPACFERKVLLNGVTCSPFSHWLEGWEIAVSLWAYNH